MTNKKCVANLIESVKQLDLKDLEALLVDVKKHATVMRKKNAVDKRSTNSTNYERYAREVFLKKVVPNSKKKGGYTLDELKDALLSETKEFAKKRRRPYANISLKVDLKAGLPKKFDPNKVKFYYNIKAVPWKSSTMFCVALWFDAGKEGMYYSSFRIKREDHPSGLNWDAWSCWEKLSYPTRYGSDASVRSSAMELYACSGNK